jgi:hypothetical protein
MLPWESRLAIGLQKVVDRRLTVVDREVYRRPPTADRHIRKRMRGSQKKILDANALIAYSGHRWKLKNRCW